MRWKAIRWGFVLGVVLFVGLVVHEVFKPLPKPVVGLVFMGFTHRADGNYARVCFTNMGATTVYYDGFPDVEIETSKGWVTNHTRAFTTTAMDYASTSNGIRLVRIPDDTIQWCVRADYSYYARHCLRMDAGYWALRNLHGDGDPRERILGLGAWILECLPDPESFYDEASTSLLTNVPPVIGKQ